MYNLVKLNKDLPIWHQNRNLPKMMLGDTAKIVIYLELPKEIEEGQKRVKERIQSYEGVIISKHKQSIQSNATITVRKMFQGGGIEKVFVLNSPWIKEIKLISHAKVRQGKLYYLRDRTGKSARLKRKF
jgi:large subunit ribosomal protein L19